MSWSVHDVNMEENEGQLNKTSRTNKSNSTRVLQVEEEEELQNVTSINVNKITFKLNFTLPSVVSSQRSFDTVRVEILPGMFKEEAESNGYNIEEAE